MFQSKQNITGVNGVINNTVTTGREAEIILNHWLDSMDTVENWYGHDDKNIDRFVHKPKALPQQKPPEIKNVFTIKKEDWHLAIKESLPVAYTCYLEPREYLAADREPLGINETTNLLDYGHSFCSAEDTTIGWPLYGAPDSEPPRELVNGQWDGRLHQVILDNFRVQALKLKLRDAITTYRKSWVSFLATGERGFESLGLRDILVDFSQLELHILQAEKQRVIRELLDLGLDSKSTIEEDLTYKQTIHPGEQEFPEKWGKNLRRLGEFVDMQLWRIKLLFYDEVQLVNNQNRADALDMLQEEGELMEAFTLHHNSDPHVEYSKPGLTADNALQKLLQHHHRVMAMARMLYLCEKIDQRLSARNTGWNVLLA